LTKTFESFALSRYDAKRKLMFIVADGMITGAGNDLLMLLNLWEYGVEYSAQGMVDAVGAMMDHQD
jgi:hypothetical protein